MLFKKVIHKSTLLIKKISSLHQLKNFTFTILLILFLCAFTLKSCQNEQNSSVFNEKEGVFDATTIGFDDFDDFPNHPFNQISLDVDQTENINRLIINNFILTDKNTLYREKDSTTLFFETDFNNFIVYLKGHSFLSNQQILFQLFQSKSNSFIGSDKFCEFNLETKNNQKYKMTFFKTKTFIRLCFSYK